MPGFDRAFLFMKLKLPTFNVQAQANEVCTLNALASISMDHLRCKDSFAFCQEMSQWWLTSCVFLFARTRLLAAL